MNENTNKWELKKWKVCNINEQKTMNNLNGRYKV